MPLFIPRPVAIELEEKWIVTLDEKRTDALRKIGQWAKHASHVAAPEPGVQDAPREAAQAAYLTSVQTMLREHAIQVTPMTSRPIEELVQMAVGRQAPV